ncbi:MAG: phosphoribosyl-AMP cyclohydrolase [Magnetococcales bacterium]|nr:phosphoribosyl-AMP cyclohydrolase [Magnetococcales bacterium]
MLDLDAVKFNADGLVPAIAQQHDTGEVLMMAWMNRESLAETLATGIACYWSRSRKQFWRKGESSGHVQHVRGVRLDCDGDTLLLRVEQVGVACHTGHRSCFYREALPDGWRELAPVEKDPREIYGP